MKAYIFDLDGTLCDISHRLHYINEEAWAATGLTANPAPMPFKKDWDSFYAACVGDKPIEPICQLVQDLARTAPIVFVSGRSDAVRKQTERWIWQHAQNMTAPLHLFMRRDGDHRPDHVVKGEFLDQILAAGWQPIMAFDDRKQVVDMWRARGIVCAQVAEGNF